MCGRFALTSPGDALAELLGLSEPPRLAPRYNIAPTQPVGIVRQPRRGAAREWALVRWGLIPGWAKDPSIGNKLINARAETAAQKPSFRNAMRRRRCLVPADGFYEWARRNGGKQPYYAHMAAPTPFAIAGLWESWQATDGGEMETCTLLTTDANPTLAEIHHRMPVIIPPEAYSRWLDPANERPETLADLLGPFTAEPMALDAVSTFVNNARNEGPDCLTPAD
jgi:putative SOS response-associated peptidase YedK